MFQNYYDPTQSYQMQLDNLNRQRERIEQEMRATQDRASQLQNQSPQYPVNGWNNMGYTQMPMQNYQSQVNPMALIQQMQPYIQTEEGKSAYQEFNNAYTKFINGFHSYQNPINTPVTEEHPKQPKK